MSIIDRYIIKKFLVTFFFIMMIVMMLAVIFDASEKLTEFIEKGASFYDIVFRYYINFILHYGNMFSALIVFISVIWFTGKMAQDTEIIPLLNSGRGFLRFLRPYFFSATLLTILSLLLNNFIIPEANKSRLNFEEDFFRYKLGVNDYYAELSDKDIVFFHGYSSKDSIVRIFRLEKWEGIKLKSILYANTAKSDTLGNWKLNNVTIRNIGDTSDEIKKIYELDTVFNFNISDFSYRTNIIEAMSFNELNNFITEQQKRGSANISKYKIHKYQRFSYPFATYILVLIGVAVSSRKSRGGIGVKIAIGLLVVLIYILAMQIFTVAAKNIGFHPFLAVWSPNIIFGIIAVGLIIKTPK